MTDTTDDYGYLLVHFIEDPDGYAEKIYMDISDGDNPHRWVPLNDGKPVLASALGTTGVRDPAYHPAIPTPARISRSPPICVCSGGDSGGWYEWSHPPGTNLIIWESDDLLHWSEPRMLDVSRKPDAPIWSSAWHGPADTFGCRTTIRKVIMAVAAHSSCTGPARRVQ